MSETTTLNKIAGRGSEAYQAIMDACDRGAVVIYWPDGMGGYLANCGHQKNIRLSSEIHKDRAVAHYNKPCYFFDGEDLHWQDREREPYASFTKNRDAFVRVRSEKKYDDEPERQHLDIVTLQHPHEGMNYAFGLVFNIAEVYTTRKDAEAMAEALNNLPD